MTTIPAESDVKISGVRSAKKALAKATGSLAGDIASALKTEPVTLPAITGRQMTRLALSAVIDSPDNPRAAVGDVEGLAASMAAAGLLEPVLVVPAHLYRAGNDQMPDASDDGRFVLIAGHRRTAAARTLGWTHIDAIVEESRVGVEARKAMIIENFQRVDLTPLEEAKAFADLLELGMKQDDLAAQVGCSQSHVSKRLGLLKLDEQVQAAVIAKELPIAEALELGKLEETGRQVAALKDIRDRTSRGLRVDAKSAVDKQLQQKKLDETKAAARDKLKKQKIAEAQNLQDLFGYSSWQFEITPAEVTKHAKAGLDCAVAKIDDWSGKLTYYCKAKKRCAAFPKGSNAGSNLSAHEAAQRQEERDRKAAMKARREAAAQLALHPAGRDTMQDFLLEQFIGSGLMNDSTVATLATRWFLAGGVNGVSDAYHQTVADIRRHPDGARLLPKYAAARRIAALETAASSTYATWDLRIAGYIHELVARVGYQPTEWEIKRLKKGGVPDPVAFFATGDLGSAACENCKQDTPVIELEDGWCRACVKAELDDTPEDAQ